MSTATNTNNSMDTNELMIELPVWVNGKRKWVTGITKKTTFDDLIYALLVQADLLKSSDTTNSSSTSITGYAIAECLQSTPSSTESVHPQRTHKGRSKVIKVYKTWQFDKLPLTILHLISTSSLIDNHNNSSSSSSSTTKLRSKIFRRFLSSKDSLNQQKLLNNYQENLNILERQKRLLDYLDEKIHQSEQTASKSTASSSSSSNIILTLNDVSQLLKSKPIAQEELIAATQLCNSIFNLEEHINEKLNISHAVEQALSNELNHVLHQQHYDLLPINMSENVNTNISNDLITLKNSIYRSRESSRMQSKQMHDLDLSIRELEILLATKYDELKYLEHETTATNAMTRSRSLTPNRTLMKQMSFHEQNSAQLQQQPTAFDRLDITFNSMKEIDEDSGINSLTSEDSNHHPIPMINQKTNNTQLETLV